MLSAGGVLADRQMWCVRRDSCVRPGSARFGSVGARPWKWWRP